MGILEVPLVKSGEFTVLETFPSRIYIPIEYVKTSTHLAGRTDLPLRIGTDKRGVISCCLGSDGWEISKNKIFHRWPCKILQGQISVYKPIPLGLVIAHFFRFLGLKTTFCDSTRLFWIMGI